MSDFAPESIKEYYIAYFDILGYKAFFKETPEKAEEFLNTIHSIITNTKRHVQALNEFPLAENNGNICFKTKVFSDNILLCLEVKHDNSKEKARIISFMGFVAEIQRNILIQYGVFLRGGFLKGELSINENYVFGQGLIEAVQMEESTFYPRIAVSKELITFLEKNMIYSQAELDKALVIENRINDGECVSDKEKDFYLMMYNNVRRDLFERDLIRNLLYKYDDGEWCLSYLYCVGIYSHIPKQTIQAMLDIIEKMAFFENRNVPNSNVDINHILSIHKNIVEQNLEKYSDYTSLNIADKAMFDGQERVLKKYVWAMVYHNNICDIYNKAEFHINTIGNCERRHMKLVINVIRNS